MCDCSDMKLMKMDELKKNFKYFGSITQQPEHTGEDIINSIRHRWFMERASGLLCDFHMSLRKQGLYKICAIFHILWISVLDN